MTRTQYQSAPTPPPPTLGTITGNLTVAKAGTYYFWLISRCIAGFTLPSNSASITVGTGGGIRITIPSTVKPTGAEVLEVVITANTSNDPSTAYTIASFPLYNLQTPITANTEPIDFGSISVTLPAQVDITEDKHLVFGGSLSTLALLPTGTDLIHGMKRYVDEVGKILEYNAEIGNELGEANGWFARYPQTFNPYVTSTTSAGQYGADREIASIVDTSAIIYPKYGLAGTSRPVGMMIVNTESTAIVVGERIMVTAEISGFDASADLVDLINLKPQGILDTQNYILDTSGQSDVGATFPYTGLSTVLKVQKEIPQYSAYLFLIEADFTATEVNNNVLNGSTLDIYAKIYPAKSSYSADGGALGNFVLKYGEFGRILPRSGLNPIRGTVTGRVAKYTFEELGQEGVYGLLTNTPNQQIVINNRGTAFASATIPNSAALRAIASTVNGVGIPTNWTGAIAVDSTKLIEITLDFPTTIRLDYPDVVAGMTAELNSSLVRVYVRPVGGGTITQFDVAIVGEQNEVIQVGISSGTNIGTNLPSVNADFGFFQPSFSSATSVTGTSIFNSSTVEIAIAYVYSNTLTSINHDEADLKVLSPTKYITELQLSLAEAIELAQYYSQVQINSVSQSQKTRLNFVGSQWNISTNLANDSTDISLVSGTNKILGRVSSGAGVIEEIACTSFGRSLIDDTDASTARTTLGLGSLATQSGTFSGTSSGTNTGDQNLFSTIAVAGQSSIVADSTSDTLTIIAGSNITLTTNATNDELTISAGGSFASSDITTQTLVTVAPTDNLIIADASDSYNLKKIVASDLLAGAVSDGDKGDITVSSSGSTWTIDNTAVTYAKIQNVSATDRLLGRISTGSGSIEEVICTDFAQSLLDDIDAVTARTTLGLGSLATQSGTFSGTSSGTNTGDQNLFSTIAIAGQNSIIADTTSDTLTIIAGSNIVLTTNATNDELTISFSGTGGSFASSDITTQTLVTVAPTDNLVIADASDSFNLKKIVASDLLYTFTSTEITGKTTVTAVSGDFILISDTSDSGNLKKVDVSDLINLSSDTNPTLSNNLNIGSYAIVDTNSNEFLKFSSTASAVNEFTITNNSTGNSPKLSVSGNDTNIGLTIEAKGSGVITFNSPVNFTKTQDMVLVNVGSGVNFDQSLGNVFTRDAVNGTVTFTVSNVTTSYHIFTLLFTYTSGTVNWFSGITWDGSSQPTLTGGKIYEFTFKTYNGGTNWYGAISFNN